MRPFSLLASGIGLLAFAACSGPDESVTHGQTIYQSYCVTCHGPGGQGDGPLSDQLPVAPADLTMLRAANDGVFPAEAVMVQIHGYPGRYHQGLMPEFGPLLDGPEVIWTSPSGDRIPTPRALVDLVSYLETLQG